MQQERLTTQLQNALSAAQTLAITRNHSAIESVHLLQALLDERNSLLNSLLGQAKGDLSVLKNRLAQALADLPTLSQTADVRVSTDLIKWLGTADQLAIKITTNTSPPKCCY